jgi:hypothetical protein
LNEHLADLAYTVFTVDKEIDMAAKRLFVVCWTASDGHGQSVFGGRDEAQALRAFRREFRFRIVTDVYRLADSFNR